MKRFLWNAFYFFVILPACVLCVLVLSLVVTTFAWPWPPSDDEMIALMNRHRSTFAALVEKVREGPATEVAAIRWTERDVVTSPWHDQVRALMREIDVEAVVHNPDRKSVGITYRTGGLIGSWYKMYAYRSEPLDQPRVVIDLHGEGATERARAALCDPNRPPELRHLCADRVWVNDLDVLYSVEDGSSAWIAERPIDDQWSLRMAYIP